MKPLDLDYDDVGATVVTSSPDGALHDLRVALVGVDSLVAERVKRILDARGARVFVLPDLGQASLADVRGHDPQLVLLPPRTDLEHRAEASRRLGWDARLRWADIDRVPADLDTPESVDALLELAALAVAPDREVQAKALLSDAFGKKLPLESVGPARLLRALAEGRGNHRVTLSGGVLEARIDVGEGSVGAAALREHGSQDDGLEGLAALTAFASLRSGRVHVFPIELACNDLGEVGSALAACASPDYAWVATRVATGRYVQSSGDAVAASDLPDATRAARPSAIESSASEPLAIAAQLEMPRVERPSGPAAPIDHVPRAGDVQVQTIVRLEPAPPEIDIPVDLEDDYEEPVSSSPVAAVEAFPLTREIPKATWITDGAELRAPLGAPPPFIPDVFVATAVDTVRPPSGRAKSRSIWPWALAASVLLSTAAVAGLVVWTGPATVASWMEERAVEIEREVDRMREDQLPAAVDTPSAEPTAPSAVETPPFHQPSQ